MRVGRVVGHAVSTAKHEGLNGAKLLLVSPMTASGSSGEIVVAVDVVGAGRGEVVLVVTGGAARSALSGRDAPVDAAIVAIVDRLESDTDVDYRKD